MGFTGNVIIITSTTIQHNKNVWESDISRWGLDPQAEVYSTYLNVPYDGTTLEFHRHIREADSFRSLVCRLLVLWLPLKELDTMHPVCIFLASHCAAKYNGRCSETAFWYSSYWENIICIWTQSVHFNSGFWVRANPVGLGRHWWVVVHSNGSIRSIRGRSPEGELSVSGHCGDRLVFDHPVCCTVTRSHGVRNSQCVI